MPFLLEIVLFILNAFVITIAKGCLKRETHILLCILFILPISNTEMLIISHLYCFGPTAQCTPFIAGLFSVLHCSVP